MQDMTRDEIKSLVAEIENPRWKLMVKVGFWHGLRVSEMCGTPVKSGQPAKPGMMRQNIRDHFVVVQRLKGSLKTVQPFVQHQDPLLDEYAELEELARTLGPKERLFPITRNGFYKVIQKAGMKAGIPRHKLHPHALKHSIAMQTIDEAGIQNVRQWLGHKSISSTGAYLRVSDAAASRAIGAAMGVSMGAPVG